MSGLLGSCWQKPVTNTCCSVLVWLTWRAYNYYPAPQKSSNPGIPAYLHVYTMILSTLVDLCSWWLFLSGLWAIDPLWLGINLWMRCPDNLIPSSILPHYHILLCPLQRIPSHIVISATVDPRSWSWDSEVIPCRFFSETPILRIRRFRITSCGYMAVNLYEIHIVRWVQLAFLILPSAVVLKLWRSAPVTSHLSSALSTRPQCCLSDPSNFSSKCSGAVQKF